MLEALTAKKNKRQRTGEGLTKEHQYIRTRRAVTEQTKLDSPVKPPKLKWTTIYSDEYFRAIEDINDAYRKMLSIGEADKVF